MSESIIFKDMDLLELKRTKAAAGEAKFSSALTDDVCRKLKWEDELPSFLVSGSAADTELAATSMTMRSKDGDLSMYEFSLDITRAHSFQFIRKELPGKKGKGKRIELHFKVSFVDVNGCAHLESYLTSGATKGTLTVTYNPAVKQEPLPGTGPEQGKLAAAD